MVRIVQKDGPRPPAQEPMDPATFRSLPPSAFRGMQGPARKPPANVPMDWQPLPFMEQFLDSMRADRKSEKYVGELKLGLARFALFCRTETGVRTPDQITRATIMAYKGYLAMTKSRAGQPLSMAYMIQLLKYLRIWINWLESEEVIEVSPWRNIKVGAVAKVPKPLEPYEVDELFRAHRQQAFAIDPFIFHRREVILALAFAWGLRIHEIVSIDVVNMDMRLDMVRVINKGGTTKNMPYGPELKGIVSRYLGHRASAAAMDEGALLVDTLRGQRLSISQTRDIIKNLGNRAGIAINPHRLRDTFGTTMLDHEVPVERIMDLMGHRTQAQTLAYSRRNTGLVAESHQQVMGPMLGRLVNGEERT